MFKNILLAEYHGAFHDTPKTFKIRLDERDDVNDLNLHMNRCCWLLCQCAKTKSLNIIIYLRLGELFLNLMWTVLVKPNSSSNTCFLTLFFPGIPFTHPSFFSWASSYKKPWKLKRYPLKKAGNTKRGKYHCTFDLLFDWLGLVCANKNENCQLSYI
jgi:hypothetical protein